MAHFAGKMPNERTNWPRFLRHDVFATTYRIPEHKLSTDSAAELRSPAAVSADFFAVRVDVGLVARSLGHPIPCFHLVPLADSATWAEPPDFLQESDGQLRDHRYTRPRTCICRKDARVKRGPQIDGHERYESKPDSKFRTSSAARDENLSWRVRISFMKNDAQERQSLSNI